MINNFFVRENRKLGNVFIESVISVLFSLTLILVIKSAPSLSFFLIFLPVSTSIVTFRNGSASGFLSLFLTTILGVILLSNINDLYFISTLSSMGIVMGEAMFRNLRIINTLSICTVFMIVGFALIFYIQSSSININLEKEIDFILSQLQSYDLKNINKIDLGIIKETILSVFPSMLIVSAFMISLFSYFFSSEIINASIKKVDSFYLFQIPSLGIVSAVILVCSIYALSNFTDYDIDMIINNFYLLIITLFYIQGAATLDFFFFRRFRFILRCLMLSSAFFMFSILPIIIAIIGFVDFVFNIRKLKVD